MKWKVFKRKKTSSVQVSLVHVGALGESRGEEGGKGRREGRRLELAAAELSREFICSHGNPRSSREKNVGIGDENTPRACVLVPKMSAVP